MLAATPTVVFPVNLISKILYYASSRLIMKMWNSTKLVSTQHDFFIGFAHIWSQRVSSSFLMRCLCEIAFIYKSRTVMSIVSFIPSTPPSTVSQLNWCDMVCLWTTLTMYFEVPLNNLFNFVRPSLTEKWSKAG